jgi:Methane oxygenase PmoA
MYKFISAFLVILAATSVSAQVHIEEQNSRIEITIDGKPFTSFYKGSEANKPYLYPLRTASGKIVTRAFPMEQIEGESTDHPHQRSLWIGAEHVSGMDFWEIEPSYARAHRGKIVFQKILSIHPGKQQGDMTVLAQWISPSGEVLLDETLTMTFYAGTQQTRMFDIDLHLQARKKVTFEDDHDAILGLRLATPFEEAHGGKVRNAEGVEGADHVRGTHSPWVDWQADVNGENTGVAIMDSPKNFRFPTPWHVRPYGMLFASPFAQHDFSKEAPDGSLTLEPGKELPLRYRILIHPADFSVAASFKEFASRRD